MKGLILESFLINCPQTRDKDKGRENAWVTRGPLRVVHIQASGPFLLYAMGLPKAGYSSVPIILFLSSFINRLFVSPGLCVPDSQNPKLLIPLVLVTFWSELQKTWLKKL